MSSPVKPKDGGEPEVPAGATRRLKLNELEQTLARFRTPHIVTVTFFKGEPPVDLLRYRLLDTVANNPWLGGRLVRDRTLGGLAVDVPRNPSSSPEAAIEPLFQVVTTDTGLRLRAEYSTFIETLKSHSELTLRPPAESIDRDAPLFRLAVAPADPGHFALVVSMHHCLGDGHTFYQIYGMLGGNPVIALEPVRLPDYNSAAMQLAGPANMKWLASPGFGIGSLLHVMFRRAGREPLLKFVDDDWIKAEKAKHGPSTSGVPYVTTNDLLTSWLFKNADMQACLTAVNMRNRLPKLGVGDQHAGNYEFSMVLLPEDAATPADVRQHMSNPSDFTCGRDVAPAGCCGSMRMKAAILTNWATFWSAFVLPDCEELLHLPVVDTHGPGYGYAIIFKPQPDKLAMWISYRDRASMRALASGNQDGPLAEDVLSGASNK